MLPAFEQGTSTGGSRDDTGGKRSRPEALARSCSSPALRPPARGPTSARGNNWARGRACRRAPTTLGGPGATSPGRRGSPAWPSSFGGSCTTRTPSRSISASSPTREGPRSACPLRTGRRRRACGSPRPPDRTSRSGAISSSVRMQRGLTISRSSPRCFGSRTSAAGLCSTSSSSTAATNSRRMAPSTLPTVPRRCSVAMSESRTLVTCAGFTSSRASDPIAGPSACTHQLSWSSSATSACRSTQRTRPRSQGRWRRRRPPQARAPP